MTTLDLGCFTAFAPVSDLSDVLLISQTSETYVEARRSNVRTYAGGRRRVVSSPGETQSLSLSFSFLERADYFRLMDLRGIAVLFRDQRGRKVFGLFASISGQEDPDLSDGVFNVSFSIEEIDVSEVV